MAELGREMKRRRRWRTFASGDVDRASNYYVDWADMDELVEIIDSSKWLLITGPFQSGKTSLARALADQLGEGYLPVFTTVSLKMVAAANSSSRSEEEASRDFFRLLTADVERDSGGILKLPEGKSHLVDMFWGVEQQVVWFLDEAALLNEIERPIILHSLLSGLRSCKEANKRPRGASSLWSFVLIGASKTRMLLAAAGKERTDGVYRPPAHDPLRPLKNSRLILRLDLQRQRKAENLSAADIFGLLAAYASDRGIPFLRTPGEETSAEEQKLSLQLFADSIYELTSGYKGMVGCLSCDYICEEGIHVYTEWQKKVRAGHVSQRVFSSRAFSRMVSSVSLYSHALQQLVLACILSEGSVASPLTATDVLPAIDDGVLTWESAGWLTVSSSLLLSAMLENCRQVYSDQVPEVATFKTKPCVLLSRSWILIVCRSTATRSRPSTHGSPSSSWLSNSSWKTPTMSADTGSWWRRRRKTRTGRGELGWMFF